MVRFMSTDVEKARLDLPWIEHVIRGVAVSFARRVDEIEEANACTKALKLSLMANGLDDLLKPARLLGVHVLDEARFMSDIITHLIVLIRNDEQAKHAARQLVVEFEQEGEHTRARICRLLISGLGDGKD